MKVIYSNLGSHPLPTPNNNPITPPILPLSVINNSSTINRILIIGPSIRAVFSAWVGPVPILWAHYPHNPPELPLLTDFLSKGHSDDIWIEDLKKKLPPFYSPTTTALGFDLSLHLCLRQLWGQGSLSVYHLRFSRPVKRETDYTSLIRWSGTVIV